VSDRRNLLSYCSPDIWRERRAATWRMIRANALVGFLFMLFLLAIGFVWAKLMSP